ncbi:MAG: hypothetical protein LBT55_04080 [Clostridiaceae bacterium]|jgi:hypothetical protein|nr:hypothetical protein [Clostridiaceae bacterium]
MWDIKAKMDSDAVDLQSCLAEIKNYDTLIWYPCAGFDVTPFYLDPVFERNEFRSSDGRNRLHVAHPFRDNGINPLPTKIYDIMKGNNLYIFDDCNRDMFNKTFVKGLYAAFLSGAPVYLEEHRSYNGSSIPLSSRAGRWRWMLSKMIPLEWIPGTDSPMMNAYFERAKLPWNCVYLEFYQQDAPRKYRVLYVCANDEEVWREVFVKQAVHPDIIVMVDQEGDESCLTIAPLFKEDKQLFPKYIVGNRAVNNLFGEHAGATKVYQRIDPDYDPSGIRLRGDPPGRVWYSLGRTSIGIEVIFRRA